jgi:beta-glucosidase
VSTAETDGHVDDSDRESADRGDVHPRDLDLKELVHRLSIEQRVKLLTGSGTWTLHPLPEIGLRELTVSDGPIGVRGTDDDPLPSAQLPAPSATAASWDAELLTRLGALMATEANRKGIDVILAPVLNLQRTPVGGRHFEMLSEDPFLSARVAIPFIRAIQDAGVGTSLKHFVGNETETDRTEYLSRIDERTLREVYLAPFEAVVTETAPWTIMAAYNGLSIAVHDNETVEAPATSHGPLLSGILKGEWNFDGVVVSDWLATKDTVESANAGLDLVMPGPGGPWEDALLNAVRFGDVPIEVIDDKVERLLRLAQRVGALSGVDGEIPDFITWPGNPEPDDPDVRKLLREAAARSTVVLRNEGLLPLSHGTGSIALIGANAVDPFVQGGGSAHVTPALLSDPVDALREAFHDAQVTLHRGGETMKNAPVVAATALVRPDGGHGIDVEVLDAHGVVIEHRVLDNADSIYLTDLPAGADLVRFVTVISVPEEGEHLLEVGPVGAHRVEVDGTLLTVNEDVAGPEVVLNSSYSNPRSWTYAASGGDGATVTIDASVQVVDAAAFGRFARLHLRHRVPGIGIDAEIEQAVEAARSAEVAVVVVGTNTETESEGWDRPTLALPGRQDELVRRVAQANPRTVVVVNAGAPVILPWLDEVAAVLWWWLPGQEAGGALADALLGVTEPSGRLPWTLPATEADVPVPNGLPVDGYVDYAEGVLVGHRGWDRLGKTPAREFGFGLGYGSWDFGSASAGEWTADGVVIEVTIANAGTRCAREIVQLYLAAPTDPDSDSSRPDRWLAGFALADVDAGEERTVRIEVPHRAFEIWDSATHAWTLPSGTYGVKLGRSSRDLRLDAEVVVP